MKRKDFLVKIAKLPLNELVKTRAELRKELHAAKMKNALRSLAQSHTIGELKKNIARINTVLTSKIRAS